MTHVIIAIDGNTFIHKDYAKTTDEICREIELGTFETPVPMKDPVVVRLQNYLLVAERDESPLLSRNQLNVLELLTEGASEKQMEQALFLSQGGIRHHVETLKSKFNVSTKQELISIYCKHYRS